MTRRRMAELALTPVAQSRTVVDDVLDGAIQRVAQNRGHDASDSAERDLLRGGEGEPERPARRDSAAPSPAEETDAKKSAAATLVDLAEDRYDFGCTEDGEAFAVSRPGHVVRMLSGGQVSLRTELASAYRSKTGRVAGQQPLADAMLVLAGIAQNAEPQKVGLRVAQDEAGTVWLDLGDKAEQLVRIDGSGWQLTAASDVVKFRRTRLTGAMPTPVAGGSLDELWSLLNVAAADRPLVLAWLVAAIVRPDIPHPILAVFGEQGTGKSSASRLLVDLIDPSPVPLRKPPKDQEGWVTAASGSWCVGLDNLSAIQPWLSDSLCRAATGDGDVRRALYTDGGLAVFAFRRVVLLNGIDVGALRGDLADRAIMVNLDRIAEGNRRTETELAKAWAEAYPRILGALLDECARSIAGLRSVRLASSPRMADFAEVVAVLDQRHGSDALNRYSKQAEVMAEDTLDAEPFLAVLRRSVDEFSGTAAELLDKLHRPDSIGMREWPKPREVTGLLKRNAPGLRQLGWQVDRRPDDRDSRMVVWVIKSPDSMREGAETVPHIPHSSAGDVECGIPGMKSGQSLNALGAEYARLEEWNAAVIARGDEAVS